MISIRRRRGLRRSAGGVVTLELTMVFPLLLCLWLITLTICQITMIRQEQVSAVRNQAWAARHQPWRTDLEHDLKPLDGPLPPGIARVLGPAPRLDPREAIRVSKRYLPYPLFRPLQEAMKPLEYEHLVLGGSWDYQEIAFAERSGHRQLHASDKVTYFADFPVSFDPFRGILGFPDPAHLAAHGEALVAHQQEHDRLAGPLEQRRQEIQATIEAKQRELAALRQRREELEAALASETDEERLAALEAELDEVYARIRSLEQQIAEAEHAIQNITQALGL